MPSNSWYSTLAIQQAAGVALTNTVTSISLLNGQAKATLPALAFDKIGTKIRVHASGRISTAASGPGTLTFSLIFGSIAVFTATTPTVTVSQTNASWTLDANFVANTVGNGTPTSATLYGVANMVSAATGGAIVLPTSSPAVGTAFDSTVSFVVDLYANWSVASASNSIRCDDYELTSCN